MRRAAKASLILLAVAVNIGLLWMLFDRMTNLQDQLTIADRKGQAAERELRQLSQELETARKVAESARDQSSRAENKAVQSAAAWRQAEVERVHAEEKAREAQGSAAEAQATLDDLRKRREDEMARMQEALSAVAPIRRTPSGMIIELSNDSFYFDFDKADLRPKNREILSRIAGVLLASVGYRLFIDGHTDDIGTAEYNRRLSERRAESVEGYLLDAGIPAELMEVRGFGQSNPRVNEKTSAARQKNRRVEIGIVDTLIDYQGPVDPRNSSR